MALEHHPQDSRIKMSENGIVQTLASNMGMGGNNVPLVMEKQSSLTPAPPTSPYPADLRNIACFNSSGQGIAGTLDANYYRGTGSRGGVEREFVVVLKAQNDISD